MAGIADLAPDERRARMLLSILSEPDDAITGRVLAREGGIETIRLLEGDGAVPGLIAWTPRSGAIASRCRTDSRTWLSGCAASSIPASRR